MRHSVRAGASANSHLHLWPSTLASVSGRALLATRALRVCMLWGGGMTHYRYVGGPVKFADAHTVVCATGNALLFTDVTTGEQRHIWTPHNGALTAFAVNPTKRICAAAAFGLHPKVCPLHLPACSARTFVLLRLRKANAQCVKSGKDEWNFHKDKPRLINADTARLPPSSCGWVDETLLMHNSHG